MNQRRIYIIVLVSAALFGCPPAESTSSATDGASAHTAADDLRRSPNRRLGDLVIEMPASEQAVRFRQLDVGEHDCELYEGCVGGPGRRSLIDLSFRVSNRGGAAIDLGKPFESALYHASLCQDAYVIDGFFAVALRDAAGHTVASSRLPTSCVADDSGSYTCRAQGLGAGESSEQPDGLCDFIDVTGLADGRYTVEVIANPDHAIPEANFDNNSAQLTFDYAGCPGVTCNATCCPEGVACVDGACMTPDLQIDAESAARSVFITHQTFGKDSCEIGEMCIDAPGDRRLLEFEARIENWGPGDLITGEPENNPLFEYSTCHGHYHFLEFTDYTLLDLNGYLVSSGHKQSFCLTDMARVEDPALPSEVGVHPPPGDLRCNRLTAGWVDIYSVGTPCQWIDITGVPEGDYLLKLAVNSAGRVAEMVTDNNVITIPVHIAPDTVCGAEVCGDQIDQDCDQLPDAVDPDCQVCDPADPSCVTSVQVSGNDACERSHAMQDAATYEAPIAPGATSGGALACGGEGGDLFFDFDLDREQVVYLGTVGSEVGANVALYRGGCDRDQALSCANSACGTDASHLIAKLDAGHYLVQVKAKQADASGRIKLKFQRADAAGAILVEHPGVYAGNTSSADDSVDACTGGGQPDPGMMGGGDPVAGMDDGMPAPQPGSPDAGSAPGTGGRDDVYVLATCPASTVSASTCGSAQFGSVIDVRSGALDAQTQACSTTSNACTSDASGAAVSAYTSLGLTFVVVDGRDEDTAGPYQLSLTY